jgi:hypothetical protein
VDDTFPDKCSVKDLESIFLKNSKDVNPTKFHVNLLEKNSNKKGGPSCH